MNEEPKAGDPGAGALEELEEQMEQATQERARQHKIVPDPDFVARMPDPYEPVIERYAELEAPALAPRLVAYFAREHRSWARAAAAALRNTPEAARAALAEAAQAQPERLRGPLGELWVELAPVEALEVMVAELGPAVMLDALRRWMPEGIRYIEQDELAQALRARGQECAELITRAHEAVAGQEASADAGAARALAWMGAPAATRVLEQVWRRYRDDPEVGPWVRRSALWGAYWVADPQLLGVLAEALDSEEDHHEASLALIQLGEEGLQVALDRVRAWIQDEERRRALYSALSVVACVQASASTQLLGELRLDSDQAVRHRAWYALAERGDLQILEQMLELADSEDILERDEALEVLARHPDERAGEALRERAASAAERGDEELARDLLFLLSVREG